MRQLLIARAKWREQQQQLVLFPEHRFSKPEAVKGELADRPRKRRRR
jgi:hypothetical protein